jgi:hypothetical protein
MTVGRAKSIISYIWLVLGIILFANVTYLTIIGRFRFSQHDWDAGLAWVIPLVFPVLGFIVPTWTLAETRKDRVVLKDTVVFFAAVFLSLVYLLSMFVILWRLPLEIREIEEYVNDVMRTSSWFLGTLQALIVAVVGKFFLEEIHEDGTGGSRGQTSKNTTA